MAISVWEIGHHRGTSAVVRQVIMRLAAVVLFLCGPAWAHVAFGGDASHPTRQPVVEPSKFMSTQRLRGQRPSNSVAGGRVEQQPGTQQGEIARHLLTAAPVRVSLPVVWVAPGGLSLLILPEFLAASPPPIRAPSERTLGEVLVKVMASRRPALLSVIRRALLWTQLAICSSQMLTTA